MHCGGSSGLGFFMGMMLLPLLLSVTGMFMTTALPAYRTTPCRSMSHEIIPCVAYIPPYQLSTPTNSRITPLASRFLFSFQMHQASKNASLHTPDRFLAKIARPFLDVNSGRVDSALKLAQSLYQCSVKRLSSHQKVALADYLGVPYQYSSSIPATHGDRDADDVDAEGESYDDARNSRSRRIITGGWLTAAYAAEMTLLLSSSAVFPNQSAALKGIPLERFHIQLVYQNMADYIAFYSLLNLYKFSSLSVWRTLLYERVCLSVIEAFQALSPLQDYRAFFDETPLALAGGCLIQLRQRHTETPFIVKHQHFHDQYRVFGKPASLDMLEEKYAPAVTAYLALSETFQRRLVDSVGMSLATVDAFIEQGLLINLEYSIYFRWLQRLGKKGPSWTEHAPVFERFLEAGLDIDRPGIGSAWHPLHPRSPRRSKDSMERRMLWFLKHGSDIHQRDGKNQPMYANVAKANHLSPEFIQGLLEAGAPSF